LPGRDQPSHEELGKQSASHRLRCHPGKLQAVANPFGGGCPSLEEGSPFLLKAWQPSASTNV